MAHFFEVIVNIDIFNTDKQYSVIYADPPWTFETYSEAGGDRSPDYKVMTLDDIKKLPVKKISAPNSILFMWVTFPILDKSFEVMKAWGFEYKTCAFTWVKTNKTANLKALDVDKDIRMNLGYYTRANAELCLLGRRGKTLERKDKGVRQVIISPLREHSRKPDEAYDRIERLFDGPYLEMFARTQRPGWDVFGNQIDKF